jgi:hypothetical protein
MILLTQAPSGNNGGTLISTVQFDASVKAIENILLDIEGVVAYIYYGAFNQQMPPLNGTVTQSQANNIIDIYNAIQVSPPVLNIV